MKKTNLEVLWGALSKKVNLILVMKDGRVIPAVSYEPVRTIGDGYPFGEPRYDVSIYREGWGVGTVIVNKFDVSEIQDRKRDYECFL